MKLLVVITLLYVSQHALGVEVEVYDDEESVLLPCQVTVTDQFNAVLWSVERLSNKIVHQRGRRGDLLENQNQGYRRRTSMKTDALMTGDLSLTLKNPTVRDSDTYTCIYREDGLEKRRQKVHLKVKDVQEVEVESGAESVLLPFNTTAGLPEDVRVEWTDRGNRKVHVYQNGPDQLQQQDQRYGGRTEMNEDLMRTGDVSLILKHITVSDRGRYTCRIYNKDGDLLNRTRVELWVKVQQVEVEVDEGKESVLLPFNTTAGLPGDVRVEWMDRAFRKVHVYQDGSVEQDQVYRDRTEMNEDLMKTGNYSLILKKPTVRDKGGYICRIYNKDRKVLREKTVRLWVKVPLTSEWENAGPVLACLLVLLLLLLVGAAGRFIWFVITDEQRVQVQVESGEQSVLLSTEWTDRWWVRMRMCRIRGDLPDGVRVEWTDVSNRKVYVYEDGSDQPGEQDQDYKGRTEMKTGDYSLILREPKPKDRGVYTCRIYNLKKVSLRERRVNLEVTEPQVEVESGAESVLSFKTTADLPEDVRVEWTDKAYRRVHVYQNGSEQPEEQDKRYKGRTEMKNNLKTGEFSLILRKPRVPDGGVYTCRIYNTDGDLLRGRRVELRVKDLQVEEREVSLLLSFQTTADPSEDVRVEWTDKGKKTPSTPGREEDPLMGDRV